MNTFGDRFKKLRLDMNLTQEQLANEINKRYGYSFSKATISQYENNKRIPEMTAIKKFVDYFNTSLDYLLCNDSYNIKEMSGTYFPRVNLDQIELADIKAMVNNMAAKDEITIDKEKLSDEEIRLLNNCIDIAIELVRKNRLSEIGN